jgi:NAD(P)-dependent dehydrogenase (short-subunit alcohol dehydrogenase family)
LQKLFQATLELFGHLEILVINAGSVLGQMIPIVTGEEKVESAIFLVNNHTHETETN